MTPRPDDAGFDRPAAPRRGSGCRLVLWLREWLFAPVTFWTRRLPAEPLALFRIAIGLCGLLSVLFTVAPRVAIDIGAEGLQPLSAVAPWMDRTGRYDLLRGPNHVPGLEDLIPAEWAEKWRQHAEDRTLAGWLVGAWALAQLGVTLGLFTRLSCLTALVLAVSFSNREPTSANGGDAVLAMGLFYAMVAPSGAAWSLDRRIRKALAARLWCSMPLEPPTVPAWGVRLAQIQIAALYLFTGLYKWDGDWLSGEAVYWMFNDVVIARFPVSDGLVSMELCRWLSWGTLIFEVGFAVAVWFPGFRAAWLLGGLLFHLGIFCSVEIGWFAPAMLAWYPLFFSRRFALRVRGAAAWLARRAS